MKNSAELSREEKNFLLEQENVVKFAARNKGPFSDIVLEIDFLKNLLKNLELVDQDLSNEDKIRTILKYQNLDEEKWLYLFKDAVKLSQIVQNVQSIDELLEVIDQEDFDFTVFLALVVREEVKRLKRQLSVFESYINKNIKDLQQQVFQNNPLGK